MEERLALFYRTLHSRPRLAEHVRLLWLPGYFSLETGHYPLDPIFPRLHTILNLAFGFEVAALRHIRSFLSACPSLKRLSICPNYETFASDAYEDLLNKLSPRILAPLVDRLEMLEISEFDVLKTEGRVSLLQAL